jgi:hypothetical protein
MSKYDAALAVAPEHTVQKGDDESQREVRMVRPVGRSVLGPQTEGALRVPAADAAGDVPSLAAPEHTAPDTQLKVERDALVEAVERRDQGIADLRGLLAAANARVAEQRESIRIALAELHAANARVTESTEQRESVLALAEERVNAANARVAELEGQYETSHRSRLHAEECLRAANARADAAERDEKDAWREVDRWKARLERAESEAADLRAELDKVNAKYVDARDRCIAAQDEVAKLRAESDGRHTANLALCRGLAAANALLETGLRFVPPTNGVQERWGDAVRAHLSGQAPARTDHERAVLKAMAELNIKETVYPTQTVTTHGDLMPAIRAELARREAGGK